FSTLSHTTITLSSLFSLFLPRRPPISTLFPYTTLFRSISEFVNAEQVAKTQARDTARALAEQKSSLAKLQTAIDPTAAKFRKLQDRKSTRLNSSHVSISYAVFCLKKKK